MNESSHTHDGTPDGAHAEVHADTDVELTSDLARAARALTKVSAATIADRAGLRKSQVREFEQGVITLGDAERAQLRSALEYYGATFVAEDALAGYGVRRRFPREKLMRMNSWENEGGSPAS